MDQAAFVRHVADRLAYGPRAGDIERIAATGADRWIEEQLDPAAIALPDDYAAKRATLATLKLTPRELYQAYGPFAWQKGMVDAQMKEPHVRPAMDDAIAMRFLGAIDSPRQLEECLVAFWFNHFNIYMAKGLDRMWTGAFVEQAIRPHVLGRFRDLVGATAKHPAMLFYLDNWRNDASRASEPVNENYARELMELHTLGVDGGYTQADVQALARILTGWTIGTDGKDRGDFVFAAARHDSSAKLFLGQQIDANGEGEGDRALDMLAQSPATAQHIGFKLAQYFLADAPDDATVAALATVYRDTNGDLRAVLRTLFASDAFRSPAVFGAKFKTPFRYVVSSVRATGLAVDDVRPLARVCAEMGEQPFGCLTPDGYKVTEDTWLNPDAMMRRVSFAIALTQGRLPLVGRGTRSEADPASVRQALGDRFSARTNAAASSAAAPLQSAVLLGSPEFMRC